MVGKSWEVFTKRVLVEKHISGIMCENSREATSHWSTLAPSPSNDAHGSRVGE